MSDITVQMSKTSEFTGPKLHIKVGLRSVIQPNHISYFEKTLSNKDLFADLNNIVETMGGAVAEHVNTKMGDDHDPEKCAVAARNAFNELVKKYEKDSEFVKVEITS